MGRQTNNNPSNYDYGPRYKPPTIISSNGSALTSLFSACLSAGFQPVILKSSLTGEASSVGISLTKAAIERGPGAYIAGGETTVTIPEGRIPSEKGGRNMHMALSVGVFLGRKGIKNVEFGAIGTDGDDGKGGAAGAWTRGVGSVSEWTRARRDLRSFNSFGFFDTADVTKTGGLIRTGPTGTNVADVILIIVN